MLCLSLLPGEYITIGDNVVLQYDCTVGERCRVVVNAPKEITVLRGKVFERSGKERPECVFDKPRWYKRELPWNRSKAQALASIRNLLAQMDDRDDCVKALRRQINYIFPQKQEDKSEQAVLPSEETRRKT